MSDDKNETGPAPESSKRAKACRRTGQLFDPAECDRCPYCFGDDADVASADRDTFCDFHPGEDPVHFGFPGNDSRSQHG